MRDLSAPADSADSAQTVATRVAAEASTVLSFLSAIPAPVLFLSSQADTTPAMAAASWATETAAWACAVCSRSSSRLFLLRPPVMGMLSIKYPLRIALMCPMLSCSFFSGNQSIFISSLHFTVPNPTKHQWPSLKRKSDKVLILEYSANAQNFPRFLPRFSAEIVATSPCATYVLTQVGWFGLFLRCPDLDFPLARIPCQVKQEIDH
uniref:Uncharacterized protein n=1 Tax=Leersia perrieri TaxID=77586 RepID=A0A0D9XMQ0_9ORYZ